MKNLYQQAVIDQKFREIFNTEKNENSELINFSKDEMEETANGFLSRFGLDSKDVKNAWTLLFGNLDEVMDLLDEETSDNENKKENDKKNDNENPAKNTDESDKHKTEREKALAEAIKKGEKLSASTALNRLNPNISIWSTDHKYHRDPAFCKERNGTNTSLEGVLPRTISGANFLQKQLGIPLVISGGTEDGHGGGLSGGKGTHGFGSKLDFSPKNGVDAAIKSYIGRSMAMKKGTHNEIRKTQEGNYETWVIKDGGYTMKITKETNVKGGDHYDIDFA